MDNWKRQLFRGARANTPAFFCGDIIRRRARASSPVRQRKVVSNKLFPKIRRLYGELYRCGLCSAAPLSLCVKIILSRSRDSFPNLVNPVNPVKKVRLCASVLILSQRLRDTETQSFLHPPLLLCPSALKLFYRRVEIHFLILSILLILSKK